MNEKIKINRARKMPEDMLDKVERNNEVLISKVTEMTAERL